MLGISKLRLPVLNLFINCTKIVFHIHSKALRTKTSTVRERSNIILRFEEEGWLKPLEAVI